jgi:hypothetical protein
MSIKQSIGTMLMGLLLGGFGWVFAANLFGVADELASKAFQQTRWMRRTPPWKWLTNPDPEKEFNRVKIWARVPGVGFILVGTALLIAGAVNLMNALT